MDTTNSTTTTTSSSNITILGDAPFRILKSSTQRLPLPPGTLGWPYFGETFQLYSQNPSVFFASKQKRYGSIFKTHVLGCPCVMVSSPEAAKFVLVTKANLFKPTFPASKERMLSTSFNVKKETVHNWRDYLRLHCNPLDKYVQEWSSEPSAFKDVVGTYLNEKLIYYMSDDPPTEPKQAGASSSGKK